MKSISNFILTLTVAFLSISSSNAQIRNQIHPDRPFQTKIAFVVPEGSFEIETGFAYEKEKYSFQSFDVTSESITLAQTTFRYGVARNFEFRADGEFLMNKTTSNGIDSNVQGIRGIAVGSKIKFVDEKELIPDLALLINLNLPYGNEVLRPDKFEPGMFLALHKSLNPKVDFGISAGAENKSNLDNYFYSFGTFLDFQLSGKLNAFLEFFGTSTKSMSPQQYLNVGIVFLHLTNFKIDFSLRKLVKNENSDWFGKIGFAVLLQN